LRAGIAADLGIEDEKAGIEFRHMGADAFAVPLQHFAPRRFRAALRTQSGILKHLAYGHPGHFQAADESDPRQD